MPKKLNDFKLDYQQTVIDVDKIKPSPFQVRKFFDVDKKKELAGSIQRDGVIQPIVVRFKNGHPEIIAGGRRVQAIQEFTEIKTVPARIVEASDIQARRIAAAENFQREDLTAIEEVEAIVELVDAELVEDKQYASMGKNPANRVKILLGKLHSIICNRRRGSKVSKEAELLYSKFTIQVEEIFENLPKSVEWRSFFLNDLPLAMDITEEVREASNQNGLNRAQTRALKKLKEVSPEEFQRVTAKAEASSKTAIQSDSKKSAQIDFKDLSGREIEGIE